MSWEIMLKDLRSRATNPEAMATRMGSGQYQPRDKPMFDKEGTLSTVEKFILFLRKQEETKNLKNAIEALGYYRQDLQNQKDGY